MTAAEVAQAETAETAGAGHRPAAAGGSCAVLALGSNLGDRTAALRSAVDALASTPGIHVVGVSPVYETAPVGGPPQPDYLNAVVLATTTLTPDALLDRAQQVEAAHGRVRRQRWGARVIDVDLIVVGGRRVATPRLVLPHPRAHERAFVLAPWLDVDPAAVLPGRGPVASLLARVGTSGVRRRDPQWARARR